MSRDPAELLDLAALVAQGSELEIDCELKSLTRLAPLLSDTQGMAHGRFRFHRVAGAPAAEGRVAATLPVVCQRCMGDLAIAVDSECRLVFADTDAASAEAPAEEEWVTTHGGRISLAELIEEELLLAMPLVGALVAREGSRRAMLQAVVAYAALLPCIALAPNVWVLAGTLLLFGASLGALDVAMNSHGLEVERRYPEPIFSSFHAGWSFGGLAGATVLRGIEGYGASNHVHTTRILSLSNDLPIIVLIVDEPDRIDAFTAQLDELMTGGLVIVDDAEVIRYGGSPERP